MVLLLTDRLNLSSNNDVYEDKQETYAQSNLVWNELMVGHIADILARDLPADLRFPAVRPLNKVFPVDDEVENRQKMVFAAIRHIWAMV